MIPSRIIRAPDWYRYQRLLKRLNLGGAEVIRAARWTVLWAMVLTLCVSGCRPRIPAGELAYQRGINGLAEGRFDLARNYFAAALAEDPQRHEALRLAGSAWLSGPAQSLADAVENFRRYLELDPNNHEVRLQLTRCLFQLGEDEEALNLLQGLENKPAVALLRGEILLQSYPEAALEAIAQIPPESETSAASSALAAAAYDQLGRHQKAFDAALEALNKNPLQEKVWYQLSRFHVRRNEIPEATRAVQIFQTLGQLQGSLEASQRPVTERLRLLRRLETDLDPSNPYFAALRAELLLAGGEPGEARKALEDLSAAREPSIELTIDHAAWLIKGSEDTAAEELLLEVLVAEPKHRRARDNLVRLLMGRGDLSAARQRTEAGLAEEPYLGRYHWLIAQIDLAEGRQEPALTNLERALHFAPWQVAWRLELAQLQLDKGQRQEAKRLLDAALEDHPKIAEFRRLKGLEPEL